MIRLLLPGTPVNVLPRRCTVLIWGGGTTNESVHGASCLVTGRAIQGYLNRNQDVIRTSD